MMTKMVSDVHLFFCLRGLQFANRGQSTEHLDDSQLSAAILLPP